MLRTDMKREREIIKRGEDREMEAVYLRVEPRCRLDAVLEGRTPAHETQRDQTSHFRWLSARVSHPTDFQ